MNFKRLFFVSLLVFACWTRAYAQDGDDPKPEPVILSGNQDAYPLGLYLELLEDPGGELTIEEVVSPEYDTQFVPSQVGVPNFGFTSSAYWVRLQLRNESPVSERRLLELAHANMHFVDLYSPLPAGSGFEVRQTGALRPPATRDIFHPHIVFDLNIPAQDQQTYYLRLQSGASMTLPLTLWEPAAFFDSSSTEQILQGIFLGIMLGLLGYNLFLLFSLRDVSYLYLVLILGGIVLYDVSQTSLLEVYIAPTLYYLKRHIISLAAVLIFVPLILFNDSFVSAKRLLPKIHRMNLVFVGVWGALGLMTFVTSYHNLAVIMSPSIVVTLVMVAVTVVLAWRKGFRAARFLLIAWAGLLVGLLLFILTRMGLVSSSFLTENSYRLAFAWMAVCWSIALADRINLLKAETESANRELQNAKERLSQTLEAMPVGVVVYGTDQRPTFANKRTAEILTNPERGLGLDLSFSRTLAEAVSYFSFRRVGSDQVYPLEKFPVYRALQGEANAADDVEADLVDWRVPLEVWASPVFDEAGNVESAVIAFQDITQRKQAEMALSASEAHFRVIVENNFDGIAFLDRDRKILYVSPSYKQLNGLTAEEMIGKSGVGTIHPDDQSYVAESFQKLLQEPGGRVSNEYRIRHKDGSWVWVETRVTNLLDDPNVEAVILNSRNITERKKTEAELANYRQHLEQLVMERTEELKVINEELTSEMAERAILEGSLQKRIEWMNALSRKRQEIKGTADLPEVLENLSELIRRLLDARSLFLICWRDQDEKTELLCHLPQDDPALDAVGIRSSLLKNAPLRHGLGQGKLLTFAADEAASLPTPLQMCLAGDGPNALLLIPISSGEVVSGVLGLVMPETAQNLMPAQGELISKIALDLAGLNEYGTYLDQSRALAAAEERNRLARDLHDSVTQVLFSASLVAEVLPQMWRRDPERGLQSLKELQHLTRGALAEMRTMLLELRPAAMVKSPLHDLLAQLTEATTSRSELPFDLFIERIPPLPKDVHANFYRIAQEALNNVVKHAQASRVALSVSAAPLAPEQGDERMVEIKLVIEDDGAGFTPGDGQGEHLGLGIMRERAADIRAALDIDSRIGDGTRVTLIWCGPVESKS